MFSGVDPKFNLKGQLNRPLTLRWSWASSSCWQAGPSWVVAVSTRGTSRFERFVWIERALGTRAASSKASSLGSVQDYNSCQRKINQHCWWRSLAIKQFEHVWASSTTVCNYLLSFHSRSFNITHPEQTPYRKTECMCGAAPGLGLWVVAFYLSPSFA